MHPVTQFLEKNIFYLLLAVLGLNLYQRRYQKHSERKRFATLYLAVLVLAFMIGVIVVAHFRFPEWLLLPFAAALAAVAVGFRRHTFPFRLKCAKCGRALSAKRVLCFDSNACELCDPHEEPRPPL